MRLQEMTFVTGGSDSDHWWAFPVLGTIITANKREKGLEMESKTLESIQTIAKIGRILSTVAHIFCLVGAIICLAGIVCIGIPGSVRIGGLTIYSLIGNVEGLDLGTCYTAMMTGFIICAGACIVAKLCERYFKNELAAGTPFTHEGARELLKLGICTICIPLGTIVIACICNAIAMNLFEGVAAISIDGSFPVVLGVAFIAMSLVCRYGAEIKNDSAAIV